jgi:DNA-binding CsgD family transcriptional regulator
LDGKSYWVVSVQRPDLSFPVPLSRAEAAVVQGLVAGRSHAQISGLRATSRRTVANQLATAFRKFGVSGRGAVVHQLIQHSLAAQYLAASAPARAQGFVGSLEPVSCVALEAPPVPNGFSQAGSLERALANDAVARASGTGAG